MPFWTMGVGEFMSGMNQDGYPPPLATSNGAPTLPETASSALASAEKSAKSDFWQKFLLVIVPVTVTAVAAVWVAVYNGRSNGTTELTKLRGTVLDDTSLVTNNLRRARKMLVNQGYNAALIAKADYSNARTRWNNEQIKMRAQIRSLYDQGTADLIYSRSSNNIIVDRCHVVVARDSDVRSVNCAARLRNEVDSLTARQDALNSGKEYQPNDSSVIIPHDFTTNLRLANALLESVASCKKPHADKADISFAVAAKRCPDIKYLQYALNLRVNLVGMSQQALEDALAEQ